MQSNFVQGSEEGIREDSEGCTDFDEDDMRKGRVGSGNRRNTKTCLNIELGGLCFLKENEGLVMNNVD